MMGHAKRSRHRSIGLPQQRGLALSCRNPRSLNEGWNLTALEGFSILLIDDHPLFRDGLVLALSHQVPTLQLAVAGSLSEAEQQLSRLHHEIDLVLVDYRLPGTNGLKVAQHLLQRHPSIAVGLLSGMEDPDLPKRAQESGLMAYLPKTLEIARLVDHLALLAEGQPTFVSGQTSLRSECINTHGLTQRQMDVLRQLATGDSNKEIARSLGISPATVKNHLEAIFDKLGAANRLQAVMLARNFLDGLGG